MSDLVKKPGQSSQRGVAAYLGILLANRARCLRNSTAFYARHNPALSIAVCTVGIALFISIFAGFLFLLKLATNPAMVRLITVEMLHFLFLFLFAGSVPFVASTLLQSQDYLLLSSAPVPQRAIVMLRLVEAGIANSLQFAIIGVPAFVACAAALQLPIIGIVSLIPLILLFVLVPSLITSVLILAALKVAGAVRLRAAIASVNLILAAVVCLTVIWQTSDLRLNSVGAKSYFAGQGTPSLAAQFSPSALFAHSLLEFSSGHTVVAFTYMGGAATIVAVLLGVCLLMGDRILTANNLAEEVLPTPRYRGRGPQFGRLVGLSPAIGAIATKDLKVALRDSILVSQVGMPVLLYLVPFALTLQPAAHISGVPLGREIYSFSVAMIAIVLFMQTSIISLSSFGLEGRAYWAVRASPNRGASVVTAKLLMSTALAATVSLSLCVIGAIVFRADVHGLLMQAILVCVASTTLCASGVGLSAALPRFVYDNPAHRVSISALVLGFILSVAYIVVLVVITIIAWRVSVELPDYSTAATLTAIACGLVISVGLGVVPAVIGARRIGGYDWEH